MNDSDRSFQSAPPPLAGRGAAFAFVALVLALGAGGAYLWTREAYLTVAPPALNPPGGSTARGESTATTRESPEATPLPSDANALLRELVARAGGAGELAGWLQTEGILRRLAAAVRLVAMGRSPRAVLPFIEIEGRLSVVEKGDEIWIDPTSYRRFDRVTRWVSSPDPERLGQGYRTLRPHLDTIFAEISGRGETFDDVLTKALGRLASVKPLDDRVTLLEKGGVFVFADPALEALSPAEKHLLRMGPENTRAIQGAVRRFAAAAGIAL